MAKTTAAKKPRKGNVQGHFSREDKNKIIKTNLISFANQNYESYGRATLEDRALPDYRDGLLPVTRRLLWSAHVLGVDSKSKFVKSARVIGDVIGRYHPHGDSAAYSAMVTVTNEFNGAINNACVGLFEGEGNWGSLTDTTNAAMRYTECRLSSFTDLVLFNKFYLPIMKKVPNFDSSTTEPVVLTALLPVVLINGSFGIAPAAQSSIPSVTGTSLLALLRSIYSGQEVTNKLLSKTLVLCTTYGGVEKSKADDGRTQLFSADSHRGSCTMVPEYTFDRDHSRLIFTKFAKSKFSTILEKGSTISGVQSIEDESSPNDRYGKIVFTLTKQRDQRLDKVVQAVATFMESRSSYRLNLTRRIITETGEAGATMRAMSMVGIVKSWVNWRTSMEVAACSYWIKEDDKEIRRLNLLIQAVDLIDFIVALVKDKKLKTNDEVYAKYAAKAKIEHEEARYVLGRPIISLRNMEKANLLAKRAEVEAHKKTLESRRAKPLPHMLKQLDEFSKFFAHESKPASAETSKKKRRTKRKSNET